MLTGKVLVHVNTTAGAGKTRYLKRRLEQYKEAHKVKKDEMLYLTFTKMNVENARKRVAADVRTIHSFAYRYLSGRYEDNPVDVEINILNTDTELFNKIFKYNVTPATLDVPIKARTKDDLKLACYNYSINADVCIETAYEILNLKNKKISLREVEEFIENWNTFKNEYNYIDFNDLLKMSIVKLQKRGLHTIKLLAIDEAQDLSPLMWKLIDTILANSQSIDRVIIAGDDDQTIYSFLNASDSVMFVTYPEVLAEKHGFKYDKKNWEHKSFRCPERIFEFAKKVLVNVKHREHDKKMLADRSGGEIEIKTRKDFLNSIKYYIKENKTIAILERHNHNLHFWKEQLQKMRITYLTKDNLKVLDEFKFYERVIDMIEKDDINLILLKQYLKKVYKNKKDKIDNMSDEKLKEIFEFLKDRYNENQMIPAWDTIERYYYKKPFVMLSTIHSFKGEEADITFIGADWTNSVNPEVDDEKRVYFVAFTRAKEKLILAKEDVENFEKLF